MQGRTELSPPLMKTGGEHLRARPESTSDG